MSLTTLSASALSRAIQTRQVSCREVMQTYLARIAMVNPLLPGEDFAWLLNGKPAAKLRVAGSHLVEGHR